MKSGMENRVQGAKCCLVVLDGWGVNLEKDKGIVDGIQEANPETMRQLAQEYLSTLLYAHGTYVGLALDTMMGNSEVGHLTIGAGRCVLQDSVRIQKAFEEKNRLVLDGILSKINNRNPAKTEYIHVLGILSDGNIHGHWKNILELTLLLAQKNQLVYIHTISDGRDTRPSVYLDFLHEIAGALPPNAYIVSVSGRYYAMDRDKRMERTILAYNTLTNSANGPSVSAQSLSATPKKNVTSIEEHIKKMYKKKITDEFIVPYCIPGYEIKEKDPIVITNFRVDRVKQIYTMLDRYATITTMTRVFSDQLPDCVLFERPEIQATLGDVIEESNLSQTRIAETEKLAHVTFFFDGGKEKKRKNEKRLIIPSRMVPTYDLAPEMSAEEVTDATISEIEAGTDFILANYANCDMVGHTGNLEATKKAVSFLDSMIQKLYVSSLKHKYTLIITADHGNAEIMQDEHGPIKSHSTNRVPFIVISAETSSSTSNKWKVRADSDKPLTLADVAPTVLSLMQLPVPEQMSGASILDLKKTSSPTQPKLTN